MFGAYLIETGPPRNTQHEHATRDECGRATDSLGCARDVSQHITYTQCISLDARLLLLLLSVPRAGTEITNQEGKHCPRSRPVADDDDDETAGLTNKWDCDANNEGNCAREPEAFPRTRAAHVCERLITQIPSYVRGTIQLYKLCCVFAM